MSKRDSEARGKRGDLRVEDDSILSARIRALELALPKPEDSRIRTADIVKRANEYAAFLLGYDFGTENVPVDNPPMETR